MKIGILSMQQVANYGSFLQAYGLKASLESLGHVVEFIDIIPGRQLPRYRQGRFHKLRLACERIKCRNPFRQIRYSLLLHKRFAREFFPQLGVGANGGGHYDAVVIGSDEVFNIAQSSWFGFSPQLFGEGLNADKVISYAACCGATTLAKLSELGLSEQVGKMLCRNFSAISVRDRNSSELVAAFTGKTPSLHIDPVLLYDFDRELAAVPLHTEGRYLLVYTYPNRMRNADEIKAIRKYAHERGLCIVSVGNYFDWVDQVVTPHPFEVLAYFRDAACVVTDTFHGTVMSIKYRRPFATIVREMNNNKLTGLLDQFGQKRREVKELSLLECILETPIDWIPVEQAIRQEQERSMDYLKSNL